MNQLEAIYQAAANVHCDNEREAAILGGLVNSMFVLGVAVPGIAGRAAVNLMQWARTLNAPALPDLSFPTMVEMEEMHRRFINQYDPPIPAHT